LLPLLFLLFFVLVLLYFISSFHHHHLDHRGVLLPMIEPLLIQNGGPIVMVQV
jgi:hypothetical protein